SLKKISINSPLKSINMQDKYMAQKIKNPDNFFKYLKVFQHVSKKNYFDIIFGRNNHLEYDLKTRTLIDVLNDMINDATIKGTGFDVEIGPDGIKLRGNTTEEEGNIDI